MYNFRKCYNIKLNFIGSVSRLFAVCVENLLRSVDETNLILRLKKMFFYCINNSREANSIVCIEHFVVFRHLQGGPTDFLHMLDVFIRLLCQGQEQVKNYEGRSRSPGEGCWGSSSTSEQPQGHGNVTPAFLKFRQTIGEIRWVILCRLDQFPRSNFADRANFWCISRP